MNAFDIVVIIIVSFCLVRGYFKGLIGEVSGIIGVVAGCYGAYTYYPMLSAAAGKWIESEGIRNIASFFILFCLIIVVISLLSILIQKGLKLAFLGWVDRSCGLVFGAAKGVIFVSVILMTITSFGPKNPRFLSDSTLAPYTVQVSRALSVLVSKETRTDLLNRLKTIL